MDTGVFYGLRFCALLLHCRDVVGAVQSLPWRTSNEPLPLGCGDREGAALIFGPDKAALLQAPVA